ncbi:MAG: sigma-70 family RNA polymerase sigma factor [Patescibacteria group bacterium]
MVEDKQAKNQADVILVENALTSSNQFSRIIEKYQEPLRRYVRRMARPNEDELDMLLQDIFIKTYENLNDFDLGLSFSSWIYRIAHNESIDFHRRNKRYGGSLDDSTGDDDSLSLIETIAADGDIITEADRHYVKKSINAILDELDSKYRSVLVLKFIEGKDYDDISHILRKPLGTIGTLIHRAKKEFRRLVEKRGIYSGDL